MAYDPPLGSAIELIFDGTYIARAGGELVFSWPYASPRGDALNFDFTGAYSVPGGGALVFNFGIDQVVPPPEPVPTGEQPDFNIPWGRYPVSDHKAGAGWQSIRPVSRTLRNGWLRTMAMLAPSTDSDWSGSAPKDRKHDLGWERCALEAGPSFAAPWRNLVGKDRRRKISWDQFSLHGATDLALSYRYPPRCLVSVDMGWADAQPFDPGPFDSPWNNPPARDRHHQTTWGKAYYREICWRAYEPPAGDAVRLDIHKPLSQVGDGDHVAFYFDQFTYDRRCRWREPSGWRDAYFYRPGTPIPAGEIRRCYFVLNQALLTRLPERTPIDVSSITVSLDVDSFCWSLSATLNSVAALDLLRPGAPVEVEVNINGHLWIMQVERWNQSRRFAGGDRSVSGRSRSANLAAPFGPLINLAEAQARTAQQLAQGVLDEAALAGVSGWSLDWDLVDWLVPANTWAVADQTPMQAIQAIAAAADGIVQTDRENKVLRVMPRYGIMPWNWSGATPDVIVPEAMILTIDGSWEPKIQFNGAFVAGTTEGGISAKVTRAGSAGDVVAPMVTDPLITATEAGLAKGRGILAASGNWERQRLSIPLFPSPTVPGLLSPGTLLQVTDGISPWPCQVIGTSVTASRVRGGVVVRQTLDVERYRGD